MSEENLIKITVNFLKPNVHHANGRVYSGECLKDMVRQLQEKIDKYGCVGGFVGDLSHPSAKDITHLIKEVHYNDKDGVFINATFINKEWYEKFKDYLAITPRGTITKSVGCTIESVNLISFDLTPKIKQ